MPTYPADEARQRGRYVLENDEHVDVIITRSLTAADGIAVSFADGWDRRLRARLSAGVGLDLPSLEDLILTKRVSARPKDLEDIRLLEILREESGS